MLVVEENELSDVRITVFGVKSREEMTTGISMMVGGLLRSASEAGASIHAHGFNEDELN